MPNIKGIYTLKNNNIEIISSTDKKHTLVKSEISNAVEDKDLGAKDISKLGYDVYYHNYTDNTMINPNRTAVLVCDKGNVPQKEWWVTEEPKEVIK